MESRSGGEGGRIVVSVHVGRRGGVVLGGSTWCVVRVNVRSTYTVYTSDSTKFLFTAVKAEATLIAKRGWIAVIGWSEVQRSTPFFRHNPVFKIKKSKIG